MGRDTVTDVVLRRMGFTVTNRAPAMRRLFMARAMDG